MRIDAINLRLSLILPQDWQEDVFSQLPLQVFILYLWSMLGGEMQGVDAERRCNVSKRMSGKGVGQERTLLSNPA